MQWKVKNRGNTTSAYKFRPSFKGDRTNKRFQLFVTRRYYVPVVDGRTCELAVKRTNQVIVNIAEFQPRNPDEGGPDEGGPDEGGPDEGGPDEGGPDEGGPDEGGVAEGSPDEGTATFFLCGPGATGCATGGTNLGTGTLGNQSGGTTTDGIAVATSPAVNTAGSPLAAGRYCFRAEWPGDSNYSGTSHTNNTTECFTVQDTTSMTTAQDWLPNDSATITSGGGTAISGSVQFSLYDTSLTDCQAGGATGRIYHPAAINVSGASPQTVSTNNTTVKVTTSKTVWWRVVFTSDDPNVIGTTSNCVEKTVLTITNS